MISNKFKSHGIQQFNAIVKYETINHAHIMRLPRLQGESLDH